MLASIPVSILNQTRPDLGIPNRFKLKSSRFSQFIAGLNHTILEYIPPGLASSAGISLTAWSREGEHIASSLRLRSLRKQEVIIPIQIKLGTEQLKIGETSLSLSDNERILSIITRTVSDFFST